MIYVGAWSGGRDSTALVLKGLELGIPMNHIFFTDTLEEFDLMYDYIEKVKNFIKEKYKKEVIVLKPQSTFEDWVYGRMTRGEYKGYIRGLPKKIDPCYWRRESKMKPRDLFYKAIGGDPKVNITTYVGYTASEKKRATKKSEELEKYPLIDWNWCEGDVDEYLKSIDLVNPLYKFLSRTGCAFCPHMSLRSYYIVWKFFNKTWLYMKKVERTLRHLERKGKKIVNKTWHDRYSLRDLERDFKSGSKTYDDTPAKECLCAI